MMDFWEFDAFRIKTVPNWERNTRRKWGRQCTCYSMWRPVRLVCSVPCIHLHLHDVLRTIATGPDQHCWTRRRGRRDQTSRQKGTEVLKRMERTKIGQTSTTDYELDKRDAEDKSSSSARLTWHCRLEHTDKAYGALHMSCAFLQARCRYCRIPSTSRYRPCVSSLQDMQIRSQFNAAIHERYGPGLSCWFLKWRDWTTRSSQTRSNLTNWKDDSKLCTATS
ncbi:hypothetical protein IWZ00DRAFT_509691 [Phyllosticta capitalensis]